MVISLATTMSEEIQTSFVSTVTSLSSTNSISTRMTGSTTPPSFTIQPGNESAPVSEHSLPTEAWVGISIGIIGLLIVLIVIVVFVIKKRQVSKNFTNQEFKRENQKRANDATERNIYSSPKDSSKDPHTYENFCPASIYQEVASTTDTKMTSNSIQNGYEPCISAPEKNAPEKAAAARNGFDEREQSSFKMSVNVLYGDGFQSKQHGIIGSQSALNGSCIYAKPNKRKKSALTDDDRTDDIYDFAENVSAPEMVYNDIYKN